MIRLLASLGLAMLLAVAPASAQAPSPAPAPARPAAPPAQVRPAAPPKPAPTAATAPTAAASAGAKRIDLNGASDAELDALPGIGPVRAKAIVANRPYDTIDAVAAKKAVPAAVLARIRDQVALANINSSSARDLQRTLPGIGDVRAGQIVAGRPYAAPADLVSKGILTQAAFDKLKDLVAY